MKMVSVTKAQFSGLHDKLYYFSDEQFRSLWTSFIVTSTTRKKEFKEKIRNIIKYIKYDLLR